MGSAADNRCAMVEDVYARFAAGDLRASVPLFDDSVVLCVDERIPDGGTYVGLAGVRAYMSGFLDPWESVTMAADSIEPIGGTVLVRVRQRGTGTGSSVPIDMTLFHLWTFRGDTVVRLDVVLDEARARALVS